MPLTNKGQWLTLTPDPTTGKFAYFSWDSTGNPAFNDDGSELVLSLLLEYQAQYWADQTGRRGALIYSIKQDRADTTTRLRQFAQNALQPALDDGRLKSVTISASRQAAGKYQLVVYWVLPSGSKGQTVVPLSY